MEWINKEVNGSSFGDPRLGKRAMKIIEGFSNHLSAGILGNCVSLAEMMGAYRFFNNETVNTYKILSGHIEATLGRLEPHPVVLALADTSFLSYGGRRQCSGLGPHTTGNEKGLNLHACLAVTPQGLNLGLLQSKIYVKESELGKQVDHKKRPIEEKESFRWYESMEHCAHVSTQVPKTQLVYVTDREGDIYEVYERAEQLDCSWLIRSARDRNTTEEAKLYAQVADSPEQGRVQWDMKARPGRAARKVIQSIQVGVIRIKAPKHLNKAHQSVQVYAVYAHELNPPADEEPISWLLLTNLPVNTLEEAIEKVQWYRCRWQIEVFFKILKSGCGVEKLQLQSRHGLENAVSVLLIVAWRIHFLSSLGRDEITAKEPCDLWLMREEWTTIWMLSQSKSPPAKPPTIEQLVRMLAKIGGHLGRKYDGYPGPLTIARGMARVFQFLIFNHTIKNINTCV
jgi:hypothetical protein